ncbi:glycosyl hydrolase family 28-related protein [Inquilinus limosus]|uniref:glycosyl hydrolase family 28-related protein n=1 Tax=Inquilinus limosus TaxID=171674 RepID=UPI0003F4EB3E|nr:glycosyl hydrolase family 28-related protein [Inquilinus limosus]
MPESAENVTYGFNPGSVLRTVAARLQEVASAKDFGAKGDGTADDTAALKTAAAYLAGRPEGGILYLPSGDYLVTDTVLFHGNGVSFLGAWPSTRIINGAADKPAIQFGDGIGINYRCSVEGLVFGQKAGVTAGGGNCGLRLVKQHNAVVRDVECYSFPSRLHRGIVIEDFAAAELLNVNAQDMMDVGISITDGLDVHGFHLRSDNNDTVGFDIVDSEGMYIVNGTAYGNAANGWRIRNGAKADSYHQFYVNCVGDTNGTTNWQIEGLKRSTSPPAGARRRRAPGSPPMPAASCWSAAGARASCSTAAGRSATTPTASSCIVTRRPGQRRRTSSSTAAWSAPARAPMRATGARAPATASSSTPAASAST